MNIIRYIVMKLLGLQEGIYNTRESYIPLHFITYREKGIDLNKFQSLDVMVLKNFFCDSEEKERYLALFCEAQSIHRRLCIIVRNWQWKKARVYQKTEDLVGNPLSSLNGHLKITLLQENTKYIFRISDLLNIWMKALTYTNTMTPQPKIPRNPYIGLDFKKHHLYQIYFHLRFNTSFDIPIYLSNFFNKECNIAPFRKEMYTLLRDDAIASHLTDSSISVLYFDILNMINGNQQLFKHRKIREDLHRANRIKVVKLLKPLLALYLPGILSCNPFRKKSTSISFKRR